MRDYIEMGKNMGTRCWESARALATYKPTKRYMKRKRSVGHKGIGATPLQPKKMEKNKFRCKGTLPAPCARNKTLTSLFSGAEVLAGHL